MNGSNTSLTKMLHMCHHMLILYICNDCVKGYKQWYHNQVSKELCYLPFLCSRLIKFDWKWPILWKTAQYNDATQINVWKKWKHVKNIMELLCYLVYNHGRWITTSTLQLWVARTRVLSPFSELSCNTIMITITTFLTQTNSKHGEDSCITCV